MSIKNIYILFFCLFSFSSILAQSRIENIVKSNLPIVEKRLSEIGIKKPDAIYIRAFKLDGDLEVWVQKNDKWQLYKTFRICTISGIPGRKRIQGDGQIPEGIYEITKFHQNSNYHLALKINYPNEADWFNSDSTIAGDEIYLHGGCVTVGCIPLTDSKIEELWTLCSMVSSKISVHIFSIKFNNPKAKMILETFCYTREDKNFQLQMEKVFFYFNENRRIPQIIVDIKGNYQIIN